MTLEELFAVENIELQHLENKSGESGYWENCHKFIEDNWDRDVETMSEKQQDWAHRILEDMTELRIEGKL